MYVIHVFLNNMRNVGVKGLKWEKAWLSEVQLNIGCLMKNGAQ